MRTGREQDQERSSQTPATNEASMDNDTNEAVQDTAEEKAAKDAAEKAAKEKAALDVARKKSVQDVYTLLKREDGPEIFIPIALEFAQKGVIAGLAQVWQVGPKKIIRGAWSVGTGLKSSVGVFIDTLKKDTAVILRDENFINTLRLPKLWTTIGAKSDEVANLLTYLMALPEADSPAISALVKDFAENFGKNVSDKTITHLTTLLSLEATDDNKLRALFALYDKATNEEALGFLKEHQPALVSLIKGYLPAGIDADKILDAVLTRESFVVLKKALNVYKATLKTSNKAFAIVKAIQVIMTCPELVQITKHALWKTLKNKILNSVPDFLRRYQANDTVNKIFEARKPVGERGPGSENLNHLCSPKLDEIDLITRQTLTSYCFKGLNIPHKLDELIITGFDFSRATIGTTESFSLSKSFISGSNFKDVKLEGKVIDLSGMQIDAESLDTLLPALQKAKAKGKKIKIYKNIVIKGKHLNIAKKMEDLGLKGKFVIVENLASTMKEKASQKKEKAAQKPAPNKDSKGRALPL